MDYFGGGSLLSMLQDEDEAFEEEQAAFVAFEEAGSELASATAERRRNEAAAQRWARCGDPVGTAQEATALLKSLAASERGAAAEAALVSSMAREALLEDRVRDMQSREEDLRSACAELRREARVATEAAAACQWLSQSGKLFKPSEGQSPAWELPHFSVCALRLWCSLCT